MKNAHLVRALRDWYEIFPDTLGPFLKPVYFVLHQSGAVLECERLRVASEQLERMKAAKTKSATDCGSHSHSHGKGMMTARHLHGVGAADDDDDHDDDVTDPLADVDADADVDAEAKAMHR